MVLIIITIKARLFAINFKDLNSVPLELKRLADIDVKIGFSQIQVFLMQMFDIIAILKVKY